MIYDASFHSGGGGCISTVPDYLKILCCLLSGGIFPGGAQILKPETVQVMFQNSLSEELSAQLEIPTPALLSQVSNPIPVQRGY
jgi:hypothetical protein